MKIPFVSNRVREWDRINALVTAFVSRFKEQGQPLYITKLLKLLFYFDFISFKSKDNSFTGDVYFKLPYGPVPSIIKDQLDLLKDINEENEEIGEYELKSAFSEYLHATQDSQTKGYVLELKNGVRLDKFEEYLSDWDNALIEELVKTFKDTSVKEIVDQTHKEDPYIKTSEMEIITYLLAGDESFPKVKIAIPS